MSFTNTSSIDGTVIYNPTKLVFGRHSFETVGKHIKENELCNALVVIGMGHAKRTGALDVVLESLRLNGVNSVVLEGVTPNPTISKVREGCEIIRAKCCDCIVALGGGSVIDASKAMSAALDVSDPWDLYLGLVAPMSAIPIFACLTISATGSEMNGSTVVTNEEKHLKLDASSSLFNPKVSFIDPTFQQHLTRYETTNGAVDAIVHATEFMLTSEDGRSEHTNLAMNGSFIRSVILCRNELETNFASYIPRANLCLAATMCLNGMSGFALHGGCWLTHFLQHAVGALFQNCSHGAGLGVILPSWLKFCKRTGRRSPGAIKRWIKETFDWEIDSKDLDAATKRWNQILKRWGHPTNMREYLEVSGYYEESRDEAKDKTIQKLVDSFMKHQGEVGEAFLTKEETLEIYDGCW